MKLQKGEFFGEFDVKPVDGKLWILQNPGNQWGFRYDGIPIIPHDGMIFDFASIPPIAWRLIGPPTGYGKGSNYGAAACESVETKAVECPGCGFMQPVNCASESAPQEIVEEKITAYNRRNRK